MAYIDENGEVRVRKPKPKRVISKWEVVAGAVLEALFLSVIATSLLDWRLSCDGEEITRTVLLVSFLFFLFMFLLFRVEVNLRHWKLHQKLIEQLEE